MLDFAIFAVTFLLALVAAVLYLYPVTSVWVAAPGPRASSWTSRLLGSPRAAGAGLREGGSREWARDGGHVALPGVAGEGHVSTPGHVTPRAPGSCTMWRALWAALRSLPRAPIVELPPVVWESAALSVSALICRS